VRRLDAADAPADDAAARNRALAVARGALVAFIDGDAVEGWQSIDFPALAVTQTIEGAAPRDGIGNPAGDMLRLLVWLANTGAAWAGGLRAGQIVTCGSWTGMTRATHGKIVTAFAGLAPVELRLTP